MKTLRLVLLLVAGAALGYAAASYSRTTYRMRSFTAYAIYANASATNPTAVQVAAEFQRYHVNDANSADAEESRHPLAVTYDLLAAPNTQTTVSVGGGVTVTDAQLAALLRKRSETAAGL